MAIAMLLPLTLTLKPSPELHLDLGREVVLGDLT